METVRNFACPLGGICRDGRCRKGLCIPQREAENDAGRAMRTQRDLAGSIRHRSDTPNSRAYRLAPRTGLRKRGSTGADLKK
jgi:hypothetical protein